MLISLAIFLLFQLEIAYGSQIPFKISGAIADRANYKIAGVYIVIQQNNVNITNGYNGVHGQFSFSGNLDEEADENYQLKVIASLGAGLDQEEFSFQSKSVNNQVIFDAQIIFLKVRDMISSSILQKCKLKVKFDSQQFKVNFIDKNDQKPLTNVQMNITLFSVYQAKPIAQYIFIDSDKESEDNFYFIVIQSSLVAGGYEAGGYGYFNELQVDFANNPAIVLTAQDSFNGQLTVSILPGNLTQVIKGQVVDNLKKGIADAQVQISPKNQIYPHTYPDYKGKTDSKGDFNINIILPACQQYLFLIQISDEKYETANTDFTQQYNLNNSDIKKYTKDLGQIQLTKLKFVKKLEVQGIIYDKTQIEKVIPDISITLQFTSKDDKTYDQSTKTDKKGHYQFNLELQGDKKYAFNIQAENKDFVTLKSSEQSFKLDDNKDFTIDLYLERNTLLVTLQQEFTQIPSASAELLKSNPDMKDKDTKYYKQAKSIQNHMVTFTFLCYLDIQYTVTYKLTAPNYQPNQVDSQPFVCSSTTIKLKPLDTSLKKKIIKVTFEGQVINPQGKAKESLDLVITSQPAASQLNAKTDKDGNYKVETDQLNPNTKYKIISNYKNDLKQQVTFTQDITVNADNEQKFKLNKIDYQGLVESKLEGVLSISGKALAKETITAQCDSLNNKVSGSGQTSAKGEFSIELQNLAEYDKSITCQLDSQSKQYSEIKQTVVLKAPDFSDKTIKLTGQYESETYTAQGYIMDATNIVQYVENAKVSLELNPKDDQVKNNPEGTSNSNGNYNIQFSGIEDTNYQAIYTVTQPDFISQTSAQLPIDKVQNFTLKRQVLKVQIQTSTVDQSSNPIANGKIIIKGTNPQFATSPSNPLASTGPDGKCSFTVECYKNVKYSVNLKIENPQIYPTNLSPLEFNCSQSPIMIPPLQGDVTNQYKNAFIELEGQVINYEGKGQSGVKLIFTTKPDTTAIDATSDKNGKYKANLDQMIYNHSYELIGSYVNAKKETVSISQNIKSAQNETLQFPIIYYESLINIDIKGNLTNKEYNLKGAGVPVTITCNSEIKQGISDINGMYEIKIPEIVKMNQTFNCEVNTSQTDKFKSSSQKVTEKSPSFSSEVNINLELTDKFQKMIKNYYQEVYLIGQAMSNDCSEIQKGVKMHIPLQNAKVQLFQYNGLNYIELTNMKEDTDSNGVFSMKLILLKIRLEELFEIKISKVDYYSQLVYFRPQADEIYQDGKYIVDLGIIPITPTC